MEGSFWSQGLNVNFGEIKVVVSGGIAKNGMFKVLMCWLQLESKG